MQDTAILFGEEAQGLRGVAASDGEGRASGPPSSGGGEAAASRLDQEALKGSDSGGEGGCEGEKGLVAPSHRLLLTGCRCRSWCCQRCRPAYWARLRECIMPHVGLFKRPRLLTLTIDRSKFASGADAHEYIESNQLIKRLLRLFGFKKALKVLAFHPKDPEWPHWHVLVDIADCGSWVDIKRLWRLWRDEWGVGGCDLQLKRKFQSGERAVSYALGYLQHQSGDIPVWVLRRTRAPRAFETYGELRQAVREARREAESVEEAIEATDECLVEPDGAECEGSRRNRSQGGTTVAERIAECGRHCSAVIETTYGDGSRYYKYYPEQ